MQYKVEIFNKKDIHDGAADNFKKDIADLGVRSAQGADVNSLYLIEGNLSDRDVIIICNKLLADPVTQDFSFKQLKQSEKQIKSSANVFSIEVFCKPGVTDAAGESAKIGISDLGIKGVDSVRTGMKYIVEGITKEETVKISEKLLANKVVHNYTIQ
ncbi:MAG: phosphoribosylformylglycinamidine synthase subunit PurS [Elusimicrobia bacterium]|nr:phosphoribosylformylglycinamidine synthase subunit PurS [Elusimicrobiota bacterium]MBU2614086.1 phosphoribosylformylglycinamidine synthase subunit PurS [Elusimicrobiota bacterium]